MSLETTATFRALRVSETESGFTREITSLKISDLPSNDVLVRVHFSSLNYKDALSASGHKGVSRNFPHTPGIDAAGIVVESKSDKFSPGQEVIITSYDLGMNTAGGFGEYVSVPAEWVVPLPSGISLQESMILGTAGFTAALAIERMEAMGQTPEHGPVAVTGASGGVGSLGVALLSKAGYEVIASTGSANAHDYLRQLGANQIISREEAQDESKKPLIRPRWSGAIDTVGGITLATLLKACKAHGSVAACGLVGSPKLETTVYPFIINGVNLLGIDSATCPMPLRTKIWQKLASDWKLDNLDAIVSYCTLEDLEQYVQLILQGNTQGRIVLEHK